MPVSQAVRGSGRPPAELALRAVTRFISDLEVDRPAIPGDATDDGRPPKRRFILPISCALHIPQECMVDPFLVQLALSFLVGGLWVALATLMAERWGARLGGILSGLPSTVVVAFLFIALTQGARQAYLATEAFPLTFSFNAIAVAAYLALAGYGAAVGLAGFVLAWLALQASFIVVARAGYPIGIAPSLIAWLMVLITTTAIFRRFFPFPFAKGSAHEHTLAQLAGRAAFCGFVISGAVLAARISGPLAGSVVAAFPAVFVTTLAITARAEGIAFSRSLCLPLMVSGMVNCVVFAAAFHFLVVRWSLALTVFLSLLLTALSSLGVCAYLRRLQTEAA